MMNNICIELVMKLKREVVSKYSIEHMIRVYELTHLNLLSNNITLV